MFSECEIGQNYFQENYINVVSKNKYEESGKWKRMAEN